MKNIIIVAAVAFAIAAYVGLSGTVPRVDGTVVGHRAVNDSQSTTGPATPAPITTGSSAREVASRHRSQEPIEIGDELETDSGAITPDNAAGTAIFEAKLSSRYAGMDSSQLREEGTALNFAYTQAGHRVAMAKIMDRSKREYVTENTDESLWEDVIFTETTTNDGTFRVRVTTEERPDLYDLKKEVEWLYARSSELRALELGSK